MEDYRVERHIGDGGFADVYLVKDSTGNRYAMKKLKTDEHADREIKAVEGLNHPNIARFHKAITSGTSTCLLFEFVDGQHMWDLLDAREFTPLDEDRSQLQFLQIVQALQQCHQQNVYHRDIKLENIMVCRNDLIKIVDFGLAAVKEGKRLSRPVGSFDYMTPEILARESYDGAAADVFSLGVVLYCMLFANLPFDRDDREAFMRNEGPHPEIDFVDDESDISAEAKDLLKHMLQVNPAKRITMKDIEKHPWIKDCIRQQVKSLTRNAGK